MAKYIRPTLDTKFHIDFAWWQKKGQNLRANLQSHACPRAKELYEAYGPDRTFDWIDPETGEVFNIDILWHIVHGYCAQESDFIDDLTPLTTAIFRTFIANNNTPLTPIEIHEQLRKKTPELILRTVGRHKVFNGIRPVVTSI
jgi:hypothetical protein